VPRCACSRPLAPCGVDYAARLGLGRMRPCRRSRSARERSPVLVDLRVRRRSPTPQLARPALIRRVTRATGQVLYESPSASARAVSPATAFLITSMLEDVIDAGTAAQARESGFASPRPARPARPTTTAIAWFVGYTPRLAPCVGGIRQPAPSSAAAMRAARRSALGAS